MLPLQHEPISPKWTTSDAAGIPDAAPTHVASGTAAELTRLVGGLDLDELRAHHLELSMAVSELARAAGRDWPWTTDDPTVALVRAVAKLALFAPTVSGDATTRLIETLRAPRPVDTDR